MVKSFETNIVNKNQTAKFSSDFFQFCTTVIVKAIEHQGQNSPIRLNLENWRGLLFQEKRWA